MFEFFLIVTLPFAIPLLFETFQDPGPGLLTPITSARGRDCRSITREEGTRIRADAVAEASDKSSYFEENFTHCRSPVFSQGERPKRQEAILAHLSESVTYAVTKAQDAFPKMQTWYTEAHADDTSLARKANFALKVELRSRGSNVSDAILSLPASELVAAQSIHRLNLPEDICQRMTRTKLLPNDSALLLLASLDENETQLHAGVCQGGIWRWLR